MSNNFSEIAEKIATSNSAAYSYLPETELLLYRIIAGIFLISIIFAIIKLKRPDHLNFINFFLLAEYIFVIAYSNNSEFMQLHAISFLALFIVTAVNIQRVINSMHTKKTVEGKQNVA